MDFGKTIKVPHERIAILIGSNGSVKKELELRCNVIIKIEGETGNIEIIPACESGFDDKSLQTIEVIEAISHGFSPMVAFRLFNEDIVLLIIDLRDTVYKSSNAITRLKGRIIGANGKSRKTIEELSGASISVYGHTVSFIGTYEETILANDAVLLLLKGRSHKVVYEMLQNARRKAKIERLKLWMS